MNVFRKLEDVRRNEADTGGIVFSCAANSVIASLFITGEGTPNSIRLAGYSVVTAAGVIATAALAERAHFELEVSAETTQDLG